MQRKHKKSYPTTQTSGAMTDISKTGDDTSVHRAEDAKHDADPSLKHHAMVTKDGDRAAELIGTQHVELTEEDVSEAIRIHDSERIYPPPFRHR